MKYDKELVRQGLVKQVDDLLEALKTLIENHHLFRIKLMVEQGQTFERVLTFRAAVNPGYGVEYHTVAHPLIKGEIVSTQVLIHLDDKTGRVRRLIDMHDLGQDLLELGVVYEHITSVFADTMKTFVEFVKKNTAGDELPPPVEKKSLLDECIVDPTYVYEHLTSLEKDWLEKTIGQLMVAQHATATGIIQRDGHMKVILAADSGTHDIFIPDAPHSVFDDAVMSFSDGKTIAPFKVSDLITKLRFFLVRCAVIDHTNTAGLVEAGYFEVDLYPQSCDEDIIIDFGVETNTKRIFFKVWSDRPEDNIELYGENPLYVTQILNANADLYRRVLRVQGISRPHTLGELIETIKNTSGKAKK